MDEVCGGKMRWVVSYGRVISRWNEIGVGRDFCVLNGSDMLRLS